MEQSRHLRPRLLASRPHHDYETPLRSISRPSSPTKNGHVTAKPTPSAPSTVRRAPNRLTATVSKSAAATPRAVSPARTSRSKNPNANLSPTSRAFVRPQTPNSLPPTPEPSRLRSLTTTSSVSETNRPMESHSRQGSITSLQHVLSLPALQPAPKVQPQQQLDPPLPIRITSKVSGAARSIHSNGNDTALSPPQNHQPPLRLTSRNRTPSISSNLSAATSPPSHNSGSSQPIFYPITTATPAANPHRYAPPRPPAATIPSPSQYGNKIAMTSSFPKIDSATAPASAPHSPPVSSVSLSSRSSLSQAEASRDSKSESISSQDSPIINGASLANGKRQLQHYSSDSGHDYDWGEDDICDEHKVKAAAKSNRKIADLEITNRSLLAINASLETTKHKQAKEIRELRRKLRESRLILPPRAYLAVKSSLDHDDTAESDDDDDDDDDDDINKEQTDEVFSRLKAMLDNLLESGKRALEAKVEDYGVGVKGGTKVLNAEEVRSWRRDFTISDERTFDDGQRPKKRISNDATDSDIDINEEAPSPRSPSQVAILESDSEPDSEEEADESPIRGFLSSRPTHPPILITHSH